MKPVIISQSPSVDPRDPHPEARITAVVLPDDLVVKGAVGRAFNPIERRRFEALYREAHERNHNGVRTSVRLALLAMRREVTERIERAEKIARG
jgi:hypothetical protein